MDSRLREQTIFAVQAAVVELLDLAASLDPNADSDSREELIQDAEQTVLRFIAGIVLADRDYSLEEQEFLAILVNAKEKPGGIIRYLNEFAAQWREASSRAPVFFQRAVRHDIANGTSIARSMIREIQLVGNNICVCDARFRKQEQSIVHDYVSTLATFLDSATAAARS